MAAALNARPLVPSSLSDVVRRFSPQYAAAEAAQANGTMTMAEKLSLKRGLDCTYLGLRIWESILNDAMAFWEWERTAKTGSLRERTAKGRVLRERTAKAGIIRERTVKAGIFRERTAMAGAHRGRTAQAKAPACSSRSSKMRRSSCTSCWTLRTRSFCSSARAAVPPQGVVA
eukprot:scaffold10725_cov35-Tisochrysis_lutea.AAC.1